MDIKEALTVLLDEEHIDDDAVYSVRENVIGDGHTGSSWEHPRVLRVIEAFDALKEFQRTLQ